VRTSNCTALVDSEAAGIVRRHVLAWVTRGFEELDEYLQLGMERFLDTLKVRGCIHSDSSDCSRYGRKGLLQLMKHSWWVKRPGAEAN
jgi:hypothetical protein